MTPAQFFGPGRKVFTGVAPGRLDVMGGIADYSGSLVLEMPIRAATTVQVAPREDGIYRVFSAEASDLGMSPLVEFEMTRCRSVAKAREMLTGNKSTQWAVYVVGCAVMLHRHHKTGLPGADIRIRSTVPAGKGVSASSALTVATMDALAQTFALSLGDTELPRLCQRVENEIVGAPCGLMDQLTCWLGRANKLLPIRCQPDCVYPAQPIPRGLAFVGIDSGVRHAVSGASYTDVRVAAFMGYSMIAGIHGGRKPYGGYLANIPVSVFEKEYREGLPVSIKGSAFLKEYGQTVDPVTEVRPETTYAVRACTRHPIEENHRVEMFRSLLQLPAAAVCDQLGETMYQSHESYGRCGLGNEVTDAIVEAARRAGPKAGIHGAKITGGGSGGTVGLLVSGRKGVAAAKALAKRFAPNGELIAGSSEGGRFR